MKKVLAIILAAMLCLGVIAAAQGETSLRQVYQYTVEGNFSQIYDSNYFVCYGDDGYGLMSLDGKMLTEKVYDTISTEYGYFITSPYGKKDIEGVLNAEGQVVIPFEYGRLSILNDTWGLGIRLKGTDIDSVDVYNLKEGKLMGTLTRGNYDRARASGDYLNIQRRSGEVEQYDGSFQLVGKTYSLSTFPNEEEPVQRTFYEEGKYGLLDEKGEQEILPPQFDYIMDFEDGLARVENDGKYGLIDENGSIIAEPQFDSIWDFEGGFAQVEKDGKFGLIDCSGNLVVPVEFDGIKYNSSRIPVTYSGQPNAVFGYAMVVLDGKTAFYSLAENRLTTEFKYEEDDVYANGVSQFIEGDDGEYIILAGDGAETGLDAFDFCDHLPYSLGRYYFVRDGESQKAGVVDWHGQEVLPCAYYDILMTADGRYLVAYEDETKNVTVYEVTDEFIPSWE